MYESIHDDKWCFLWYNKDIYRFDKTNVFDTTYS